MKHILSFSKLLFASFVLLLGSPSFGQTYKFKNAECSSAFSESSGYEWYGGVKNGLADGFGFLAKDTVIGNEVRIFKAASFKNGALLPDSFLVNRNLKISLKGDTSLTREPFCQQWYRYLGNPQNSHSNTKTVIEYETPGKVFWLYALYTYNSRQLPHYQLKVLDRQTGILTRYGKDCSLQTYYETKTGNGNWVKTVDGALSLSKPGKLESEISEMLNLAVATQNREVFFVLFNQLFQTYGEWDGGARQYSPAETEFKPKYATLLAEAEKWPVSIQFYNFFNTLPSDPFLKKMVEKSKSNYLNDKEAERAKESGVTIRYTFNKDVIGKRYVPPITKRYTATVAKFYINDEEVEITESRTSTSGGYDETRTGYIAIYQLINSSGDYLVVPLSITGTAQESELKVITTGFFNTNQTRGKITSKKPFEVRKTFLLDPKSMLKEQLETGEEIPADFRISAGEIQKVDLNWVTRLSKALEGDPASLDLMLADKRAVYWKDELKEMKNKATIKAFAPLLDISLVPVNKLTFDPDFESEVVMTIHNRSAKSLEVYYSNSIGKKGIVVLSPGTKAERKFTVKGQTAESLKAKVERLNVSTGADFSVVKDIEGNSYKTAVIGNQIWMAENLRTTRFNDGTQIPVVTDSLGWNKCTFPALCWFKNDEATYKNDGALYNGYVAKSGKICPPGWHLPSSAEWEILEENLTNKDAAPLKSNVPVKWLATDGKYQGKIINVTNEYQLNIYPSGSRNWYEFRNRGKEADFWTSTKSKYRENLWTKVGFDYRFNGFSIDGTQNIERGNAIRCIRD